MNKEYEMTTERETNKQTQPQQELVQSYQIPLISAMDCLDRKPIIYWDVGQQKKIIDLIKRNQPHYMEWYSDET